MLVARDTELELVLTAAARAAADGLVTTAVRGEAGIGKTAVLGAVSAALRERGWQVLPVEADDLRRRTPYGAVVAGCRAFAGQAQNSFAEQLRAAAVRALDVLAVDPGAEPELWFGRAEEAMTRLLTALTTTGPLAVCLDDAERLDDDSQALLTAVLRRLATAPVALVATTGAKDLALLEGTTIELGPLDAEAIAAITAPVLGGTPDDELVREIHERSDGNPLLALELARSLAAQVEVLGGRATRPAGRRIALTGRQALLRRLAPLSPDTAAVARAAAILGRVRTDQLGPVAEVTRLPVAAVAAAFDELVEQDLLRPRDGSYGFGHELVREALYDEAGPACRRVLHGQVADRLGEDRRRGVPVDLLELAWHVTESAVPGDAGAVEVLREAAALAKARAPERTVELTGRALELADDVQRPGLLGVRCRALVRTGRPADAIEPGLAALAALPPGDERTRTLTAVLGSLFSTGRTAEALRLVDSEQDAGSAGLHAQRALLLVFAGRDAGAADEAARAEALLAGGAGGAEAVVVHCQLAVVMSMLIRQDRMIEHVDAALAAAGQSALLRRQALALGACITSLSGFVADASERLRAVGSGLAFDGELLVAQVAVDWLGGNWDAALQGIARAGREPRIEQQPLLAGAIRAIELDIRTWRGELEHAAQLAARPAPAARNMANLYALSMANHLAELSDVDSALAALDDQLRNPGAAPYACVLLARRIELELDRGGRPGTDLL
ncbi:MAG TPA: AAA family ATPase, partial [Kribbellaceae bacterium]|nr:AAA family ATPase [Kribbellaceae bacterium]